MLWIVLLTFLTFCRWTLPHLIQVVNYCPMAGACVHDRHPVCGQDSDGCNKRSFLDVCDMYEYNCDYGAQFTVRSCPGAGQRGGCC